MEKNFTPDFKPQNTNDDFGDVKQYQPLNHRIFTRIPGAREIGEGEVVFYVSGSTRRMYTKLQGVMVYTALTT